jgi:transposase
MPAMEIRLTRAQRRALHRVAHHAPSVHAYQRAVAILAVDEGESVAGVAARLGVTRQSVYNWLAAFAQAPSPEALLDRYGGGRPGWWTPPLRALLSEAMASTPEQAGLVGPQWTVPLLQEYLAQHADTAPSDDTVRRELQRLGYVWKRFRYVLPPDPEVEKKTANPPAFAGTAAAQRQAL